MANDDQPSPTEAFERLRAFRGRYTHHTRIDGPSDLTTHDLDVILEHFFAPTTKECICGAGGGRAHTAECASRWRVPEALR